AFYPDNAPTDSGGLLAYVISFEGILYLSLKKGNISDPGIYGRVGGYLIINSSIQINFYLFIIYRHASSIQELT
ncbi:hypothetical protein ACJX0J_036320, partial [Zea mays]